MSELTATDDARSKTAADQSAENNRNKHEWHLVLASMSPRRHELLKHLSVPFEILPSQVEEIIDCKLAPPDMVLDLARQKAQDVFDRLTKTQSELKAIDKRDLIVLGADTIVVLDGKFFGKPSDHAEARSMLAKLSGRCHEVYTGVVVIRGGQGVPASYVTGFEVSKVHFRPILDAEIEAYAALEEPMDKAGAYALQGTGSAFVERIDGCFTNIIGLPIPKVVTLLRQTGISILGLP